MKVVVNHLTRMQPGYICVAGIDLQSNAHVRPVLVGARLSTGLLKRHGGPFDIAAVVDLGTTQPLGRPPETEDQVFDPALTAAAQDMGADRFWKLLKAVSRGTLAEIFGDELQVQRSGCAVNEGMGITSLGCMRPATSPDIFVNGWGKLRARVSDGSFDVDLSVTDLRFYKADQRTPRKTVVADVQRRIKKGVGVILSVGLARAFKAQGDTARRHWSQVNNLHLEDERPHMAGNVTHPRFRCVRALLRADGLDEPRHGTLLPVHIVAGGAPEDVPCLVKREATGPLHVGSGEVAAEPQHPMEHQALDPV